MRIIAKKVYAIEFNGPEDQYILIANDLMIEETQHGLDSMDAGDATGAFISLAQDETILEDWGAVSFERRGYRVTVSEEWERFTYEGAWA